MDYINGQRFAELCGQQWSDTRIGPGPLVYCLSHEVKNNIAALRERGPCILVTHCSDMTITDEDVDTLPPNVKAWYGTNMASTRPRAAGIPIGFANRSGIPQDVKVWETRQRTTLMYLCHTYQNPALPAAVRRERQWCYEAFGDKPWVLAEGGRSLGDVPFVNYMEHLKTSYFVLSPRGAGPDCHRVWEALAVGCIPIVKRHPAMRWFINAPILFVDTFADVTAEHLRAAMGFWSPTVSPLNTLAHWEWRIRLSLLA